MKNNYIKSVLLFCLIFLAKVSYSQNKLADSKHSTKIKEYIQKQKLKVNLSNDDVSDLLINKEIYSKKSKSTQLYMNQRFKGIKIHNAISSVSIKDNVPIYFSNRFVNNIRQKINVTEPLIDSKTVIQKAASYFKLENIKDIQLLESKDKKYIYSNGRISQNNIPVELVYFKMPDGNLRLSWDLNIYTLDSKHWWSIRIDAVTGELLDINDWVISCSFGGNHIKHEATQINRSYNNISSFNLFKTNSTTMFADGSQYNIYPLPIESPNHGSRQIVNNPADNVASPFGWHDDDGIAGAEYTTTQGNNVVAQLDSDGNNGTGDMPDGTASLNFNFPLDFNQQPSGYQNAAITNLFYWNNIMHDIWYHYGFDTESGNFQQTHYNRVNFAGSGDPVQADAQDGSGLNNANFSTPPDGNVPRMQMFLFDSPGGDPMTVNGGPLAGDYSGTPASFGGDLTETPITSDLVVLADNDDGGTSSDPNDGCDTVTNGAAINGNIAVIRRGDCEFGVKVLAAENAGAIAVIVVNNVAGDTIVMGEGAVGDQVTIPSIMISQSDGEAIIMALLNGDTVNASVVLPDRIDGDFDNGVIAHEYGHGISTRLTGGASNSNCLSNVEQMGEGWSDWFALMLTMKATDVSTTARGIGTFISGEATNGPGIRFAPYSTDFSVNGFTYAATLDNTLLGTDTNGDPVIRNEGEHYIGWVWCTALWDLSWAYINKYGFDTDLYNGTGGNNKVMQIVIDGLKLQPCNPGMVDGRDAILAADMTITGGEDQCLIWEVFAKRGLGVSASQGTGASINDQVEDFTEPAASNPTLANCTTLSADSFTTKDYKVYPNPTNNKLTIKAGKNLGDATLSIIDINGRHIMSKKATLLGEVELDVRTLQSGLYILSINGEYINTNEKIIIK